MTTSFIQDNTRLFDGLRAALKQDMANLSIQANGTDGASISFKTGSSPVLEKTFKSMMFIRIMSFDDLEKVYQYIDKVYKNLRAIYK